MRSLLCAEIDVPLCAHCDHSKAWTSKTQRLSRIAFNHAFAETSASRPSRGCTSGAVVDIQQHVQLNKRSIQAVKDKRPVELRLR